MRKILIVDDEPSFQILLRAIFSRAGYLTEIASNSEQALTAIEVEKPDLIVLDDMMPGMSGSDLCKQLKSDLQFKHIPIILYTAGVRFQIPGAVDSIGAEVILPKTTRAVEMLKLVEKYTEASV
jgi:CheY-like chemotaxis protein